MTPGDNLVVEVGAVATILGDVGEAVVVEIQVAAAAGGMVEASVVSMKKIDYLKTFLTLHLLT